MTPAGFDFAGWNGRGLDHDVMDVVLTLATNTPLADAARPSRRSRPRFPFVGAPYPRAEQDGLKGAADIMKQR